MTSATKAHNSSCVGAFKCLAKRWAVQWDITGHYTPHYKNCWYFARWFTFIFCAKKWLTHHTTIYCIITALYKAITWIGDAYMKTFCCLGIPVNQETKIYLYCLRVTTKFQLVGCDTTKDYKTNTLKFPVWPPVWKEFRLPRSAENKPIPHL